MKGVRHLLIRWKGYGEESDTWEPESTVNCPELLKEYNLKKGNISNGTPKKGKTKKIKKPGKSSKPNTTVEDWDENEEFEVIITFPIFVIVVVNVSSCLKYSCK